MNWMWGVRKSQNDLRIFSLSSIWTEFPFKKMRQTWEGEIWWIYQGLDFVYKASCRFLFSYPCHAMRVPLIVSDFLWPHAPTRLLCPWDFPVKNTGVGCHFLFQGIFQTQGLNLSLSYLLCWQAGSLPLHHLGSPFSHQSEDIKQVVGLVSGIQRKFRAGDRNLRVINK